MDQEVELVRTIMGRFNEGDRELRPDEWCEDVELVSRLGELRGGGPYRGHAGVVEWVADVEDNFGEWRASIREVRPVGERVLVLGQVHLRGKGSGLALDQDYGWVFDFRDGRVSRMAIYPDPAEAEREAGVP